MPIKEAKLFDVNSAKRGVKDLLLHYAKKAEYDFSQVTRTWKHGVKFTTRLLERGNDMSVVVWTADKPFKRVNDGTAVRFATMTQDFKPKTKPGVLRSTKGRGGVAFVSKNRPRPGIVARDFTGTIMAKHEDDFYKDLKIFVVSIKKKHE